MSDSKHMINTVPVRHEGAELMLVRSIDLHRALNVGRAHAHWVEDRKTRFGLVKGVDFMESDSGGEVNQWRRTLFLPLAALRIALAERTFRGVETPNKRMLRRQNMLLKDALLEARPELDRALRHHQNSGLTDEEREQLVGGRDQWLAAVEQLTELGFIEAGAEQDEA